MKHILILLLISITYAEVKQELPSKNINNQTEEQQLAAIMNSSNIIKDIINPTERVQISAVKGDIYNINYIKNPTPKVQLYIAKKDSCFIVYISNQTEEMQLAALNESTHAYEHFTSTPSSKVQLKMLKMNLDNIAHISKNNLSKEAEKFYLNSTGLTQRPFSAKMITDAIDKSAFAILFSQDVSEKQQYKAIAKNPEVIRFIKNPTLTMQKKVLEKDMKNIEYIKNPSEELQIYVINDDYRNIRYINNPSEKIQIMAIEKDGFVISSIKNPTLKVQKLVVSKDGRDIDYIKNPSLEIQRIAVNQMGFSITSIDNPPAEIQKLALLTYPNYLEKIKNPSKEMIILALQNGGYARYIEKLKNPSGELKSLVVSKSCSNLEYIKDQPQELVDMCLKKDPLNIKYVKKQSEEMQLALLNTLVNHGSYTLAYLKNPSQKVIMAFIEKNVNAIVYVKNPSKVLQMFAVKKNINALSKIKKIDPDVADYIFKNERVSFFLYDDLSESSQMIALKYHPEQFENFKNPTRKVQEKALTYAAKNILKIDKPDEDLIKLAIKSDYRIVEHLKLSDTLRLFALNENLDAFYYMQDNSAHVKDYYLKTMGLIDADGTMVPLDKQKEVVKKEPWIIKYIKNPSEDLQRIAVKQDGHTLELFQSPSDAVKLLAIQQNGWAIQYIKLPSHKMKEIALKVTPQAIKYIENPSEDLQLLSVIQDGRLIGYIKKPTPKVQFIAIKSFVYNAKAITKIDDNVMKRIIKLDTDIVKTLEIERGNYVDLVEEEIDERKDKAYKNILESIKKDGLNIQHANKSQMTDEVKKIAVRQNPKALLYMDKPSFYLKQLVMNNAGLPMAVLTKPTVENQTLLIEKFPWYILLLDIKEDNPLIELALNSYGDAISLIKNPSEELQLKAVQNNALSIQYIDNPTEKVLRKALKQRKDVVKYIRNSVVNNNRWLIQYLVQDDAKNIRRVANLSEKEKLKAISWNPDTILRLDDKTDEMVKLALSKNGDLINKVYPLTTKGKPGFFEALQSFNNNELWKNTIDDAKIDKEMLSVALNQKGLSLESLTLRSKEERRNAIKIAPWIVRFMTNLSETEKEYAVTLEPEVIVFLSDKSAKLKTIAINGEADLVMFLNDIPEDTRKIAVNQKPSLIRYFKFPSKELQMIAVAKDPFCLEYIADPCEEAIEKAVSENKEVEKYVYREEKSFFDIFH